MRPDLLAALAGAVVLVAPAGARAWTQAVAREAPHHPLHIHDSNCIPYTLHAVDSPDLPLDRIRAAVIAAFDTWTAVDCSYLAFVPTEEARCCRTAFLPDGPNANCLHWIDDEWPAEYPPAAVALTTITYRLDNGAILDTDVAFNAADFVFADDCRSGASDLRNTLTHEAGHMLGLDHSAVAGATMRPRTFPGDCTLRDLAPDDVEGLCALYPTAAAPPDCAGPWHGLDLDCTPPPEDCGCRTPGLAGAAGSGGLPVVLLLAVGAVRRRRREKSGPRS